MFKDRMAAGQILAKKLDYLRGHPICILAVPRGGIVIAEPIAHQLDSDIQVLVTRKIGHPANSEVAIGAVMPDGSAVWDRQMIERLGVSKQEFDMWVAEEYLEVQRRQVLYTGSTQPPDVTGKTAIVVDDGIATGYTIRAAIQWLKHAKPLKIIIAVPVAPSDVVAELAREVDDVICLLQPEPFWAVGMHYEEFSQTTDEEVAEILYSNKKR
ncbi:MAG: phosphoribosyltransferase [Sporomusaceae bacterium]|nr:phosphoribosyltransferase [Sporomusaceae bacterium]